MTIHALAFSGAIGTGKTTIANIMVKDNGYHFSSFGDYLRGKCLSRNLPISRENLQNLGQECITEGWEVFCSNVLANSKWNGTDNLVIDGIRHAEAVRIIREIISPIRLIHVHIIVQEKSLRQRIEDRNADEITALDRALLHESEAHQDELSNIADYKITNALSSELTVIELKKALERISI